MTVTKTKEFARQLMVNYYVATLGVTEEMAETLVAVIVKADTDGLVAFAYQKGYEAAKLEDILRDITI